MRIDEMTKYKNQYTKKVDAILDYSMSKIKSVPYKVSPRWLYYQCIQAGLIKKSYSAWKCFGLQISRERKKFQNGWHPDILADSIREPYFIGHAGTSINVQWDTIEEQENYVQCWFEAQAMYEQFLNYTSDYRVSLVPFRGDVSISLKWQIAKYLEQIHEDYPDKPIKILYFGDCDKKGSQIPKSALKDIKDWCTAPFDFEFVGLTLQQAQNFNLPTNPSRINQYQWEALSDEQAKQIIIYALAKYVKPIPDWLIEGEEEEEDKIKKYADQI